MSGANRGGGSGGDGRQPFRPRSSPTSRDQGTHFDNANRGGPRFHDTPAPVTANVSAMKSGQVGNAAGSDFVVCARHNARRKACYCIQAPVYDADHNVVRYQFECKESEPCNPKPGTAATDAHDETRIVAFDMSSSSATQGRPARAYTVEAPTASSTTPAQAQGEAAAGDAQERTEASARDGAHEVVTHVAPPESAAASGGGGGGGGRGPPARYYDLQRGGAAGGGGAQRGGFPTHKVCWTCGLPGHEKPDCPNGLCNACHGKRRQGEYHTCVNITLSDFFASDVKLPQTADGLPATKCLYCGELGHMDCSASVSSSPGGSGRGGHTGQVSCSFCGRRGHASYDCGDRTHQNPDRYALRQEQLTRPWNSNGGGGGGGYQHGNASNAYDNRGGGGGYHSQEQRQSYGGNNNSNNMGGYRDNRSRDNYRDRDRNGGGRISPRDGDRRRPHSPSSFPSTNINNSRDRRPQDNRRQRGSPMSSGGSQSSASHFTRRAGRKRYGSSDDEGPLY